MKAYEKGERWVLVNRADTLNVMNGRRCVARCQKKKVGTESEARLIAESPERDELLRELFEAIEWEGANTPASLRAFVQRIEATLRRTEEQ